MKDSQETKTTWDKILLKKDRKPWHCYVKRWFERQNYHYCMKGCQRAESTQGQASSQFIYQGGCEKWSKATKMKFPRVPGITFNTNIEIFQSC